jgi:hypothetical protein
MNVRPRLAVIALAFVCLQTGCRPKTQSLLLNRRMDREQARATCTGQSATCVALANTEIGEYESEFVTAFAEDSHCHKIELLVGPEELDGTNIQADWHFDITRFEHTNESDDPVFHWTLFTKNYKMYEGDYADLKHEKPSKAADSICKIISGVGGFIH